MGEKMFATQGEAQADVDVLRPGQNGSFTLMRMKPNINTPFRVSFVWRDASGEEKAEYTTARVVEQDVNGKPKWTIDIPASIMAHANTRFENKEFQATAEHRTRATRAFFSRLNKVLKAWAKDELAVATLEANDAAVLLSAVWTKTGILGNGLYRDFLIEHGGQFVIIDQLPKSNAPPPPPPPTTTTRPSSLLRWLRNSTNLVLEGVPGTGKTHAINALKVAYDEGGKPVPGTGIANLPSASGRDLPQAGGTPHVAVEVRFMTMHPSTSYEDFVEGLRPAGDWTNSTATQKVTNGKSADPLPGPWFHEKSNSTTTDFALKNGFFVEACVAAVADPNKAVVVVLDELNRCNIPKVLGDLMTVIEESKRARWDRDAWVVDNDTKAVTLPYSGRKLFVPDNLFIVGTMNTTDRSVAPMDAALRRRFSFHRIWPQGFGVDADKTGPELKKRLGNGPEITASLALWRSINDVLLSRYGADAMLGHSYLDDLSRALKRADAAEVAKTVEYHWDHRILPQLMDVIASNGLTRSLVTNPAAFFALKPQSAGKPPAAKATAVRVFRGRFTVELTGEGSLRTAMLRFKQLSTMTKEEEDVADKDEAAVAEDGSSGDE